MTLFVTVKLSVSVTQGSCDNEKMSIFAVNLKQAIVECGLTAHNIAMRCQIDPGLMNKIINGKRKPSDQVLNKLAACKELECPLPTLTLWRLEDARQEIAEAVAAEHELIEHSELKPIMLEGFYRFPCRGTVAAGPLTPENNGPADTVYYEFADIQQYSSDMFCLKICGDSMAPEFQDGGILLLRPTQHLKPNGYYVIETNQGTRTFKAFRFNQPQGCLEPLNENSPSITIDDFSIKQLYSIVEYKKSYET